MPNHTTTGSAPSGLRLVPGGQARGPGAEPGAPVPPVRLVREYKGPTTDRLSPAPVDTALDRSAARMPEELEQVLGEIERGALSDAEQRLDENLVRHLSVVARAEPAAEAGARKSGVGPMLLVVLAVAVALALASTFGAWGAS